MKKLIREHIYLIGGGLLIFLVFVASSLTAFYKEKTGGNISLSVPNAGSQLFVDNKKELTTFTPNEEITFSGLSEGAHSILVFRPGFLPWAKEIDIKSGDTSMVTPFIFPAELNPEEVAGGYEKYQELFQKNEAHITSTSGNVSVSINGNTISADWLGGNQLPHFFCDDESCNDQQIVFSHSKEPIQSVSFFPGREDLIIFSVSEGIYAIELDKRGTQNFQPVYVGEQINFATEERDQSSILYVKDKDLLFGIAL